MWMPGQTGSADKVTHYLNWPSRKNKTFELRVVTANNTKNNLQLPIRFLKTHIPIAGFLL